MLQHACAAIISKYSNTVLKETRVATGADNNYTYHNFHDLFHTNPQFLGQNTAADSNCVLINDDWVKNHHKEIVNLSNANYVVDGYFQQSDFLNAYKQDIRNVFMPTTPLMQKKGTLVHMRFAQLEGLDSGTLEFYINALEQSQTVQGYLAASAEFENHEWVDILKKKFNLQFLNCSPAEVFDFARGVEKVIVGAGSFAWWVATFAEANGAQEIYCYDLPADKLWHGDFFDKMGWKRLR